MIFNRGSRKVFRREADRMFERLGKLVSRHPWWFLAFWPLFGLIVIWQCPTLSRETREGVSSRLPERYESCQAQMKLAQDFKGQDIDSSLLVILIHRDSGLVRKDYTDRIPRIIEKLKEYQYDIEVDGERRRVPAVDPDVFSVLTNKALSGKITSESGMNEIVDSALEERLTSKDKTTTLIAARLRTIFVSNDTRDIVQSIIRFLDEKITRSSELDYYITGPAAIGHDYSEAVDESLSRTEIVTYLMVIVILILIYRSPVAAVMPLLVILLSLWIAMGFVAVFAKHVTLIPTLVPVFMTVVMFGAGTNYCLFLVGRYKEELGRGLNYTDAARVSITQVGAALGASAGTEVLGLALLVFAEFDIFSRTGVAVGSSLIVALAAAMTLMPAIFLVLGKNAFWPGRAEAALAGTTSTRIWRWVAAGVCRRPGRILLICLVLMAPLAYFGATMSPSYDLFSELPKDMPSVAGHDFLIKEFVESTLTEQLTAVVSSDTQITTLEGKKALGSILTKLENDPEVAEVRCLVTPLGKRDPQWEGVLMTSVGEKESLWGIMLPKRTVQRIREAYETYVSTDQHSTKIDIVLKNGTFSHEAMNAVPEFRTKLRQWVAEAGLKNSSVMVGGLTAYMNDLRDVTNNDLRRLVILVLIMVYVFLVWLMRDWFSPLYMLGTMILSYLVTIGMADLLFRHVFHDNGLDWKVRFFLFVLLIAIGEDYNIYLMSRVREEALKHGMREGVRRAIIYTGSIISACGLIMAGTFGAMMAGRIALMIHIGFAMAFGIMLDTFIIRPVIVPAIALLLKRFHFWYRHIVANGRS